MLNRFLKSLSLINFACLSLVSSALAVTWRVPDVAPTIAEGIGAAAAGDTVLVACGHYYESGLAMKSGVILKSTSGQADCVIIDAMGEDRVLSCINVDAATRIEGITFTHGASNLNNEGITNGGGLYCRNARLSIVRCNVVANIAVKGGGVYCDSSSVIMVECHISDNHAVGAYLTGGSGGGIDIANGSADTLRDCTISGNDSNFSGGGIHCYGSPLISRCRIANNLTDSRGGGIYCGDGDGTDASIEGCLITGNAGGDGGGAHIRGTTTLTGCLVADNTATWGDGYGGGISCRYHTGVIGQSTIVGNEAISAGGIAFYGDGPQVSNCIIAATVDGGAVGWGYAGPNSTPIITCCDIWGNIGGFGDAIQPEMIDGGGNICADPQFCGWARPDLPFTLAESSPCAHDNNPGCGLVGAFEVACSDPVGVGEPPVNSAGVRLFGNYPNPFNPMTTIRFDLPKPTAVTLRIYDVSGRLVRTLLQGQVVAQGRHDVVWNGRDDTGKQVAAGVYFYRVEAGEFTETKRMVLIR